MAALFQKSADPFRDREDRGRDTYEKPDMNKAKIIELQKRVGTPADGFWGPKSTKAAQRHLRLLMPYPNPWPSSNQSALRSFYGEPGDESNLVRVEAPIPMYYEGQKVKTLWCHKLVAKSLVRALKDAYNKCPIYVQDYAGIFNNRNMRGGKSKSTHAWGVAIDLRPETNGNRRHWPTSADMPIQVMEAFAREGWTAAGAFWSRDAMHFQAVKP